MEGKTYFVARDCAVVAEVFLYAQASETWYVLLGKRGTGVPDYQGFWGFPCGYLDWNETLFEAVQREIWEETGLALAALSESDAVINALNLPKVNNQAPMPWKISDTPHEGEKQNVSHHYGVLVHWQDKHLPSLSIENAELNEAEAVAWVAVEKALTMEMAFRHAERLAEIVETQQAHFDALINL